MKEILVIKLGYSETLDRKLSLTTSLGDVLRTTFILNYFKEDRVTWLVDGKAVPLLNDNKYIDQILVYNPNIEDVLRKKSFDIIINFEKNPEICMFAKSLRADKFIGFGFNGLSSNVEDYFAHLVGTERLVEMNKNIHVRRNNEHSWQKILADALDKKWNGEEYVLGYKPTSDVMYDIGFNWTTSNKWANKIWPHAYWVRLRDLVEPEYSVSWQSGLADLYEYMEWINSCRIIVTSDTLGLHLGLALRKRVVALFGPTSWKEICFYNCGVFLVPDVDYDCIPCLEPICRQEKPCMEFIYPEKVKEKIDHEFKKCYATQTI